MLAALTVIPDRLHILVIPICLLNIAAMNALFGQWWSATDDADVSQP
ncbi:hypothetical protein Rcae01_05299 [Novipirellula caenicola]|uniref:Uncharacterized protein n=1 Tax=Novipirellula caenicola TaxID=1536901 RepID=A0ABP9VYI9_9BACT